jgi:uncharacterized coiled-coil protein SlyX
MSWSLNDTLEEFATSVGTAAQMGNENTDIRPMIAGLIEELQEHTRAKIHPLVYANLAFLIGIVFACGSLWNRVATLESRSQAIDAIQVVNTKVDAMQSEISRLRDRLDLFLDQKTEQPRK